jgi:hypothetical protein
LENGNVGGKGMGSRFYRLVDAGFDPGRPPSIPHEERGFKPLLPEEGEFVRAMQGLAEQDGLFIPNEVFLHLFTQELLERMREGMKYVDSVEQEIWVLPFWPECLFEAAGQVVHGAREIQALYPPCETTFYVPRAEEVMKEEARRVLGGLRFEIDSYLNAMASLADRSGWTLLDDKHKG